MLGGIKRLKGGEGEIEEKEHKEHKERKGRKKKSLLEALSEVTVDESEGLKLLGVIAIHRWLEETRRRESMQSTEAAIMKHVLRKIGVKAPSGGAKKRRASEKHDEGRGQGSG